ncbi:adenylyl-sulfate kinase, partial [Bacteroidota bacterium]
MNNLYWHEGRISNKEREIQNNQKAFCIWFTGLPASGKSTLANELEHFLFEKGFRTYLLDGDNVRHGLNGDLGFSSEDRTENIRRIGEVTKLFIDAGIIVLSAFISPFHKDRQFVRDVLPDNRFVEVYVACDLETCERRDPKGIYKKARTNEIKEFTGISSPYEVPVNPEITI